MGTICGAMGGGEVSTPPQSTLQLKRKTKMFLGTTYIK